MQNQEQRRQQEDIDKDDEDDALQAIPFVQLAKTWKDEGGEEERLYVETHRYSFLSKNREPLL